MHPHLESEASGPIIIAPGGDIVLDIRQSEGSAEGGEAGELFEYRVDSKTLRQNSRYFENLLSERFNEGATLSAKFEALKLAGHSHLADAPLSSLPHIPIANIGRVHTVSGIRDLAADFLRALHEYELAAPSLSVPMLANIAVVADRFDALECLRAYVGKKKYLLLIDMKGRAKEKTKLTEERVRQKLLIGLLLNYPSWLARYSKHLIIRDSVQWKAEPAMDDKAALWWDIPQGIEDEMIQRREYILETINSMQSHFLKLYSSRERQCKLGYDSSANCDSFQLGEMIRFFLKVDTLRLQGTIYDGSEPTHYSGDIEDLLDSLRQCREYQIDNNHSHCGLRTRLLPVLDTVQGQLSVDSGLTEIGICAECWSHERLSYAWSSVKRPLMWIRPLSRVRNIASLSASERDGPHTCLSRHTRTRDMFMAVDRDWTPTST